MPQDELTVIVEYDTVAVQIDEPTVPIGVTLISNMGPPGPPGVDGDPGPAGPTGATGATGPMGATGPTGPAGADGTPGQSFAWQGTWGSGITYDSRDVVVGSDDVIYISKQSSNTNHDPVTDSTHTWWDVFPIVGVQGPTGPTGPTGPAGSDGADGATGPAGADGADGVDGSTWYHGAGAPSNGTGIDGDYYLNTTNGDVYTKSSGSWGSPIENLTGPTGATGPAGADGADGVGVPTGGTTDQILAKASNTDFDTAWVDNSGGSGDVAGDTHAATSKTTPIDADEIPLADSAASFILKKLTWANLKATLKTYFDTLYPSGSGTSTGTNTGDQTSVSGNAGTATTLQTSRNIDGQAFNGSADITVIAPGTHAATSKTTPVDADELPLVDSAASNVLKKLTWANLKATLKTYFDTLYAPIGGGGGSVTKQVELFMSAPDASGNGYAALIATSNIRQLVPAFTKDVDGDWWGRIRIPQDYASGGAIILRIAANDTNGTVSSFIVSTKVVDTGATWDAALTDETVQDTTMSTTAYRPTDVTFTLSTTPVAGKDLIFKIRHNGTRTQDTLAQDTLLLKAVFQYST